MGHSKETVSQQPSDAAIGARLTPAQNRFWANHAYHRGETVLKNLPEIFAIESTNFCNLKCVMCPRGEPDVMERVVGHMPLDLFERILDQMTYFCDPCVLHWFGEPLMNPKLFEQIAIAKRRIPNLGMSTNATLLDKENAARILDSGLDTLFIAIDGASAEVYEGIRKGAFSFDEVTANATTFLEMKRASGRPKPRVVLSIIQMRETEAELEQFRTEWLARGADEIRIKPFITWGNQMPELTDLAASADSRKWAYPRSFPCKYLWSSVVIAWDGRVVPCCYDYDAKMDMGDLKTSSLAEIWNSPRYVEFRRAELEGRNDTALCATCSEAPGHRRNPQWGAEGSPEWRHTFPESESAWRRWGRTLAGKAK